MTDTTSWALGLVILVVTLIFIFYKYMTRHFGYWETRGVKGPKPSPFYGNLYEIATFTVTPFDGIKRLYDYSDSPYIGIYVFDKPVLFLRSPKLIKDVLIKDSTLFYDKTINVGKHNDLIKNLLFFQTMPEWKQNRMKMNPCLSPNKLKLMYPLMKEIGEEFQKYMSACPEIVNVKDLTARYFVEIIVRCMFGIQANSFSNEKSEFMKIFHDMFAFTWRNAIAQGSAFFMDNLVRLFRLDFFESSILNFLSDALNESMKTRKPHGGKAKDLIDMMNDMTIETENGEKLTSAEILGSAISFFLAGTETATGVISFLLHELAVYPDIQDKLRSELKENVEKNGEITYESIQKMPYADMCIYETLRKYPIVSHFCRKPSTNYHFEGTELTIEKGSRIYIPVYAIQMDKQYFPEPATFDPERFRDFKGNATGLTFFPFSAGPRACLGDRLAMIMMKEALSQILLKYRIERLDNTPDHLEFIPKSILLKPKTGYFLKLKSL